VSDRKYKQRGYQQDDSRPARQHSPAAKAKEPFDPRIPRDPRVPNMPGFRQVTRCARCGNIESADVGSMSKCAKCGTDLHACIQCVSFDPGAVFECTQKIPKRVSPKDVRNDCTLFAARQQVERETRSQAPTNSARKAFDDLFKI